MTTIDPDAAAPRRKPTITGETKFMITALLVILLGGCTLFVLNGMTNPKTNPIAAEVPSAPESMTAAKVDELFTKSRHQKGNIAGAELTMVEFADFECPSCRRAFNDTIKTMDKTLPAYRMGFYHLPLPMHKRAVPAVVAAEAAAKQGKFWEMYAQLFDAKSEGLSDAQLTAAATRAGLDVTRFASDVKNPQAATALATADTALANGLGVDSTPTFFMHDKAGTVAVVSGAGNLKRFAPDLKNGVIGDDKIDPPDPQNGVPVAIYRNGKRENR